MKERKKKNLLIAQTTRLASFGPVFISIRSYSRNLHCRRATSSILYVKRPHRLAFVARVGLLSCKNSPPTRVCSEGGSICMWVINLVNTISIVRKEKKIKENIPSRARDATHLEPRSVASVDSLSLIPHPCRCQCWWPFVGLISE